MFDLIKKAAAFALDHPESQTALKPLILEALAARKAKQATGVSPYQGIIDHGYDQALSGGTDVMKRLQNQLLLEQSREPRDVGSRLASGGIMTPGENFDWTDSLFREANLNSDGGSIEAYLEGTPFEGEQLTSVRTLTDVYRDKNAFPLPAKSGTRVQFAGNMGSVLAYADPPAPGTQGTVVTVRSAMGDVTGHEGKVFVQWDDGKFRSIHAEHLRAAKGRQKKQASFQLRLASLGDLTDFMKVSKDTLIHKSTRDLWSVKQEGGEYVIERLFDDTGDPLRG